MSGGITSISLPSGMRNYLIGGNLSTNPWQRGTSTFTITGSGSYTADRWFAARGSSASGQSIYLRSLSSGDLPGTLRAIGSQRANGNTGTEVLTLSQSIESIDSIQLCGVPVALSFYARKGAEFSGTFQAIIYTGTGTDENVVSGFTGSAATSSTLTLSETFQRFTVIMPASNFNQIAVYFQQTPSGTAGAADWFEVAQIQLAPVMVGNPFFERSYKDELALCHRYYVKPYGSNDFTMLTQNSTTFAGNVMFPVPMYGEPDVTLYDTSTSDQVETFPSGSKNPFVLGISQFGFSKCSVDDTTGLTGCAFSYLADASF